MRSGLVTRGITPRHKAVGIFWFSSSSLNQVHANEGIMPRESLTFRLRNTEIASKEPRNQSGALHLLVFFWPVVLFPCGDMGWLAG